MKQVTQLEKLEKRIQSLQLLPSNSFINSRYLTTQETIDYYKFILQLSENTKLPDDDKRQLLNNMITMLEINLLDPKNFDPFMIIWSNIRASLRQLFSDEVRIKLEYTLDKWRIIVDGLSLFKKKKQKQDLSKEEESTLYSMMVLLKTVRNALLNKIKYNEVSQKQGKLYEQIVNKMNEICPPPACKMVIGKGGNGQVIARDQKRTIARKLLQTDSESDIQHEYEMMKKYHKKAPHLFVKPYSLGSYYYDMQLL